MTEHSLVSMYCVESYSTPTWSQQSMAEEGCLLVMVVDMHPQLAEHDTHTYLNAIEAFANLHLAANVRNSLAVLAANHLESRFLYPSSEARVSTKCD